MTEDSKTSPLSEVSASITRIGHAIRPRVGAVAVNSNGRGVHADFEKLSASEERRDTITFYLINMPAVPA